MNFSLGSKFFILLISIFLIIQLSIFFDHLCTLVPLQDIRNSSTSKNFVIRKKIFSFDLICPHVAISF